MVKYKALLAFGFFSLGSMVLHSETPAPAPSTAPTPVAPATGNNIKIFDDRVFNLDGGTSVPEFRVSPGGTVRYLDNTKELNYTVEQRDRWLKNCAALKEVDFKRFKDCVGSQAQQETSGRANFGTREPRSSEPSPSKALAPAPSPRKLPEPEGAEEPELRDPTQSELEGAE
jgi:hypothetical protein